jgi:hypothetical protein
VRLSPHTATACQDFPSFLPGDIGRYSPPSHSPGSYFEAPDRLWPFALYAAFPRSNYYDHADSRQTHRRFSGVIANLLLPLSLPSSDGSPMVPLMDSNRIAKVAVIRQPLPAYRGSRVDAGYVRFTCTFLCNTDYWLQCFGTSGRTPTPPVRHSLAHRARYRARGAVPRRLKPASCELTIRSLSQARRLGDLPPPHRYLSGACCSPRRASERS